MTKMITVPVTIGGDLNRIVGRLEIDPIAAELMCADDSGISPGYQLDGTRRVLMEISIGHTPPVPA